MNSILLKEAIADARAVRATALANAKASLEEAFNSRFSAVFADKLREDSSVEDPLVDQPEISESTDCDKVGSTQPSKSDGTKKWSAKNTDTAGKPTSKSITPNNIPSPTDGGDKTKPLSKINRGNAMDGTPNGIKEVSEVGEEESVEEMVTNEDLDEIIKELEAEASVDDNSPNDLPAPEGNVAASVDSGPPNEDPAAEDSQEIKSGDTVVISKIAAQPPTDNQSPETADPESSLSSSPTAGAEDAHPMEEEDIDLNELLASLNEESKEEKEEKEDDGDSDKKEVDEILKVQLSETTSQRDEAYRTVEYLKKQLNEINLLNAKLLYTNKLFKEFGMNRDQKTRIIEAFDLTKTVREVKLTYANWCESLDFGGKARRNVNNNPLNGLVVVAEGKASKTVSSTKPKEIITENCNEQARRFQKLAGINVKK